MTKQVNKISLKRLISSIFLPIVFLQTPVLAQTTSLSPDNGQPSTPAATQTPKPVEPILVPLNGTAQVRLNLVNCGNILDCGLFLVYPIRFVLKQLFGSYGHCYL